LNEGAALIWRKTWNSVPFEIGIVAAETLPALPRTNLSMKASAFCLCVAAFLSPSDDIYLKYLEIRLKKKSCSVEGVSVTMLPEKS
jgi:hypothetical protein